MSQARCCAIMQPTFFPWAGYFNLISQADDFVFLDNVQLEKQSWQTRNRVLAQGREQAIIAPIENRGLGQTIAETRLHDPRRHFAKLARQLAQSYARHPFGEALLGRLLPVLDNPPEMLGDFNIELIRRLSGWLGLRPTFQRASQIDAPGTRSERLAAICQALRCRRYLSPPGSRDYLMADGFPALAAGFGAEFGTLELVFQNYHPAPYRQFGNRGPFVSHLSIVDVVANLGWEQAALYVRQSST